MKLIPGQMPFDQNYFTQDGSELSLDMDAITAALGLDPNLFEINGQGKLTLKAAGLQSLLGGGGHK